MAQQHGMGLISRWLSVVLAAGLAACGGGDSSDEGGPDADVAPRFRIEDPNLEQCVREAIAKPEGDLEEADVAGIENLECQDRGIASIVGLEAFTGLKTLSLWENEIADISPIAGATALEDLELGNNSIFSIKALAELHRLKKLGLSVNLIQNLTALAGLTELRWLSIDHNDIITDAARELCALDGLVWLTAEKNRMLHPDVLSCLENCDWYAENQRAGAMSKPVGGDLVRASAQVAPFGFERVALSDLSYWAGAGDRLKLAVERGERSLPVIAEFAGELQLRGDRILYHVNGTTTEVGELAPEDGGLRLCTGAHAAVCSAAIASKGPWNGSRTVDSAGPADPVYSLAMSLTATAGPQPKAYGPQPKAYGDVNEELMPYVFASPNQFDAGSCLFMATTGSMEILLNQHADLATVDYKGDTDLSERFLMNASDHVPNSTIRYLLTDVVYAYNKLGGSMLDRDYPFVADYVRDTSNGGTVPADADDEGAYLSCYYNWFDDLPSDWRDRLVETPKAERTTIFVDPLRDDSSQWRVALMGDQQVELIKHELRTKRAPVLVVYNHYLYWHASIIVGYDDTANSNGCPMVESTIDYFEEKGADSYVSKIRVHQEALGGCSDRGIFYVRDSIYDGGGEEPNYVYNEKVGVSDKYSKRIIKRSYNWVRYLSNHAYAIHRR